MRAPVDPLFRERMAGAADRAARVEVLFATLHERGHQHYDEQIDQLAHALQTAELARRRAAPPELVVAGLLHDFGHLLEDEGEEETDFRAEDRLHEEVADRQLRPFFGPAVTEAIRLHVAAKRYLCAVDPRYHAALSAASVRSLSLQGGPMDGDERAAFEAEEHHEAAVQLRRWDDGAKVVGRRVPPLESYRELVEGCLRRA